MEKGWRREGGGLRRRIMAAVLLSLCGAQTERTDCLAAESVQCKGTITFTTYTTLLHPEVGSRCEASNRLRRVRSHAGRRRQKRASSPTADGTGDGITLHTRREWWNGGTAGRGSGRQSPLHRDSLPKAGASSHGKFQTRTKTHPPDPRRGGGDGGGIDR